MEISSTADWQGCLLAFNKLDQAFENDINAATVTLIFSATVYFFWSPANLIG